MIQTIKEKYSFYKNYISELVTLSIPIFLGNVGNLLVSAGDVIVAGRHSTITLAAISIATAIFMTFLIAGVGFLSSISPVVANRRGKRVPSRNLLRISLGYSFYLSLVVFALIWIAIYFVPAIGLAENLAPLVIEYLKITSFSIFGVFIFTALKEFLQAYEIVVFPNAISIVSIFANLLLNIILVFGFWIIPSLGVKGLAIATLTVRTIQAIVLFVYCMPFLRNSVRSTKNYIKDLIKTGWPISLALFAEFLGFNITAILVGKFSALFSAVHNIIITMSGITYMIPLSISNAIAIKVGFANGEKNIQDVKRYSAIGAMIVLAFMLASTIIYLKFPVQLIKIFTNDALVIKTGLPLISIVVCYLIFDGIQASSAGALKGLKQTKPIMYSTMFSYLFVGIPMGCVLAYHYHIVLVGFWSGLATALFVASIISTTLLIYNIKKIAKKY